MFAYLSSLLTFGLLAAPVSAFIRTAPPVLPNAYNFTNYGGNPNVSDIIAYNDTGIKSYWWANFLVDTKGNDYCLVTTLANAGPSAMVTSVSIVNITGGEALISASYTSPGQVSTTEFYGETIYLTAYANTADQFTSITTISNLTGGEFNLTYLTQGPNLYQVGSGAFLWGGDLQYAFDNPQTLVTGTMFTGKEMITIDSSQSLAWFDMQWGPGYASQGWFASVVVLDNGIYMQVTVTTPTDLYRQASLVTVTWPDGHQEVHAVVPDVKPSNPWVSPISNITYYQNYVVTVPDLGLVMYYDCPVQGGETPNLVDPIPAATIADTFAYITGTMDGVFISGQGIAERRLSATETTYGT